MWPNALPYIAAIVLAGSIYTVGHVQGSAGCEIKSAKKEVGTAARGEQRNAKIEMRVNSLSDIKLDDGLSRFLLD